MSIGLYSPVVRNVNHYPVPIEFSLNAKKPLKTEVWLVRSHSKIFEKSTILNFKESYFIKELAAMRRRFRGR
jgi:hypothetical protein